jgi:hypothetical protein
MAGETAAFIKEVILEHPEDSNLSCPSIAISQANLQAAVRLLLRLITS